MQPTCTRCGRPLTNATSKRRNMGRKCRAKLFASWAKEIEQLSLFGLPEVSATP